jgi:outer membrane protein
VLGVNVTRPRTSSFLALALFLVVSTAAAETKIAVVDLQSALMQTEDGMRAAATLKNYTASRQADLDKRQEELQKEQDDLRKQSLLLSRRAIQRRTEHWQRRMLEVQSKFIEYNKTLQKKQSGLMDPILKKLFAVVRRAASRRGFDLVVDKAAVPYARSDLDLTDVVVQMYNSGGGGDGEGDDEGGDKKDPP